MLTHNAGRLSAALAGKDPVRSELVASADLLTPKRLTEVLRGSEHLDRGEVLTSRVSRASADDGSSFGYDANGNMTSVSGPLGSWTLAYDDQNRLTSMAYPSGTDTFTYNALGQRMRANLNGSVLRYIYSGDRVVEQTDDEGNMLTRYGLATGSYYDPLLGLEFADGDQRYPLSDLIGTARRLVDESGTATDAYSLDAFGRYMDGWTNQTPSPYRFGGAWGYTTDTPGSGLLQLGARFYWPEVGRFVSQDPIGDGVNWYAYADDNPLTGIDPEGLVRADDVYDAVGNFLGGATDTLSFGLAAPLRRAFGVREAPDPCSGWYTGGKWTGRGLLAATAVAGAARMIAARAAAGVGAEAAGELNFASERLLADHAARHGAELGLNAEEYLEAARNFIRSSDDLMMSYLRADGTRVIFARDTEEFAVVSGNTIRTYFVPEGGSLSYFLEDMAKHVF